MTQISSLTKRGSDSTFNNWAQIGSIKADFRHAKLWENKEMDELNSFYSDFTDISYGVSQKLDTTTTLFLSVPN